MPSHLRTSRLDFRTEASDYCKATCFTTCVSQPVLQNQVVHDILWNGWFLQICDDSVRCPAMGQVQVYEPGMPGRTQRRVRKRATESLFFIRGMIVFVLTGVGFLHRNFDVLILSALCDGAGRTLTISFTQRPEP